MFYRLAVLLVAVSIATAADKVPKPSGSGTGSTSRSFKIDLASFGTGEYPEMEFSKDGKYIMCWWLPHPPIGDYNKLLGKCVVFDREGNEVKEAADKRGRLSKEFVMMFATTASRQQLGWFLNDTNGLKNNMCGFSEGYTLGFRFLKPEGHFLTGNGEMWHLTPSTERLWVAPLPEKVSDIGLVSFFARGETNYLLVAFCCGSKGYVLSKEGNLLDSFTYGILETDPDLSFNAGTLSFDASQRLLACGALLGKRVRVVRIDPPHKVVFEAHTRDNPRWPWGGEWTVNSVQFECAGKYLIAGYDWGGRIFPNGKRLIEIFDTSSWRVVWSTTDEAISSSSPPRISPDGMMLAFLRVSPKGKSWDASLEVHPFEPRR